MLTRLKSTKITEMKVSRHFQKHVHSYLLLEHILTNSLKPIKVTKLGSIAQRAIKCYTDLEAKRMYSSIKCENWKSEEDIHKHTLLGKRLRSSYFTLFLPS